MMKSLTGSIYTHELIGAHGRVKRAPHQGYVGLEGNIEDETMKTLTIDGKMVPKKDTVIEVERDDYEAEVLGDKLIHRPEERTKRLG